jgi:hypothetical protein
MGMEPFMEPPRRLPRAPTLAGRYATGVPRSGRDEWQSSDVARESGFMVEQATLRQRQALAARPEEGSTSTASLDARRHPL